MRKKRKLNISKIVVFIIVVIILVLGVFFILNKSKENKKLLMIELTTLEEANTFTKDNNLKLEVSYEYSDEIEKDKVISQSIKKGTELKDNDIIIVVISKGKIDKDKLASDGINELGKVPIMMYHGIREKTSNSTGTVGGNVDKDGYNRTPEAFRKDLESYYEKGYRMIRLDDYINGKVDVEYGKSPIILTFDDGNEDNIKVTGLDDNGNIIIDKNSAVGILEEFKKKHPDANVTATFFVNGGIFNQSEYNDKILKWMLIPVLPIVAFYVMKKKNLDDNSNVEISRKKQWILCAVCSLAVGCYDGFYGPGTGTFLLILYTGVAKLPVAKASGTMKLANLSSNIMALVVFLFSGKIVIYLGLAASVFSIAGHYVGSGMVMKNGNKIVRPIILIVLVLLFIKIITGM